jgi:putative redox protein
MTHGTATIRRDSYATYIQFGIHQLVADEPASLGGADAGPAPYDLLLASLGACTAITLRMYADRKSWPVAAIAVRLRLEGTKEAMRIERVLDITGADAAQKARLAEIAERTPVTLTLKGGIPIDTSLALWSEPR